MSVVHTRQEIYVRRIGELKVQVDRWPLTGDERTPHLLTVICVGMYERKPDAKTIIRALSDAVQILRSEQ